MSTLQLFGIHSCKLMLLISALIASASGFAKDALQILPTRIVFATEKSADLTLINKGEDAGTYRILLRNIRTDDYGQFSAVEKPATDEKFADKMIRYSPRSVTIEPNSNQKVRLVVRRPPNLAAGEYRTHMVFQSLPKEVPSVLNDSNEVSVSVEPIVEISIPVIVRVGELDADISLSDISLTADGKNLDMVINRSGTRSLYGDIEVMVESGDAAGMQVGFVKGVSVYVPNALRKFILPLNLPTSYKPKQDNLLVRFKEDPSYGGEQVVESKYFPH